MLWYLSCFSHERSFVPVSLGTLLFFLLALLASKSSRPTTRLRLIVLAYLSLLWGWIFHLDAVVSSPPRDIPSDPELSGILWYILMVGAPSWLLSLVVTAKSADSPRRFVSSLVEISQQVWAKALSIFFLTGLQFKMLFVLDLARAPEFMLPLSLSVGGFFLSSLLRTL